MSPSAMTPLLSLSLPISCYFPLLCLFLLLFILPPAFFSSFLLALPLPKWILISHYPTQRALRVGIGQKFCGDEGKPPAMNTTICVQSPD